MAESNIDMQEIVKQELGNLYWQLLSQKALIDKLSGENKQLREQSILDNQKDK